MMYDRKGEGDEVYARKPYHIPARHQKDHESTSCASTLVCVCTSCQANLCAQEGFCPYCTKTFFMKSWNLLE
jgi:hypothetical protein